MNLTFDTAFSRLINIEKGFTDNPDDDGNWTGGRQGVGKLKGTKYGISAATYPDLDIKNLTIPKAKALYLRDWWEAIGADTMDGAIVYQIWGFAVNASIETAKRKIQAAVRVADDGKIGPITLKAINKMSVSDVLLRFTAQKIRYYKSLSKWPKFGKGWMERVAEDCDYGADDS